MWVGVCAYTRALNDGPWPSSFVGEIDNGTLRERGGARIRM